MLHVCGRVWRRLVFWTRRDQLQKELAEELELHLQLKEEEGRHRTTRERRTFRLLCFGAALFRRATFV